MAKTRGEMNTLINTNLSSSPTDKITALEHNEVARESLNYVTGQVVAGGSHYIGDIPGGLTTIGPISLGITIPGLNYTIVGHFTSLITGGSNLWDLDNDGLWDLKTKTSTSFSIVIGEWAGNGQNLNFDWLAIVTETVLSI
tara:strand:- start:9209 stop:9631 length:423 start_codon:yes stop_codon:yes gene_type:complete